jgi:hypothetical protein
MDSVPVSRRRFIASAGVTITLPMLPSLLYTKKGQASSCEPVKRFVAYMFGNGHHMADHLPPGFNRNDANLSFNVSGQNWQLPVMLESMQDLKQDLVFVSGLENQHRRREFGDHAIGCGSLLTARKPTPNQQWTNMSVDQAIADAVHSCRGGLHSLQLGTHNIGFHDQFGDYYTRNISWRGQAIENGDGTMSFPEGAATPLYKEVDPQQAFDRLFEGIDPEATAAEIAMRRDMRKSVLDAVVPHGDWLRNRLNAEDQAKVDELFTGIRSLEQEIDATVSEQCIPPERPPSGLHNQPRAGGPQFEQQVDLMHDLMVIALQCDITRVITFMQSDALSDRNLSFVEGVGGVTDTTGDHDISHHAGDAAQMSQHRAAVLWKMGKISQFIRKMKTTTDFDGQPLLSNSLVWVSSEIADGNAHDHRDKPILLAGQLGGLVTTDRHVRFPPGTYSNFTNVKTYGDFFITLLDLFDVKVTSFGQDGQEPIVWHH